MADRIDLQIRAGCPIHRGSIAMSGVPEAQSTDWERLFRAVHFVRARI